jgi:hypothetical protein
MAEQTTARELRLAEIRKNLGECYPLRPAGCIDEEAVLDDVRWLLEEVEATDAGIALALEEVHDAELRLRLQAETHEARARELGERVSRLEAESQDRLRRIASFRDRLRTHLELRTREALGKPGV